MSPELYIVVEGHTDEAVVRRVCAFLDIRVARVFGKKGKDDIAKNLHRYNEAAKRSKWLVIRDLDHDAECAPSLKRNFATSSSQNLAICFAVREVEAWLLADSEN
nr:hypothetical protein [bacterium]